MKKKADSEASNVLDSAPEITPDQQDTIDNTEMGDDFFSDGGGAGGMGGGGLGGDITDDPMGAGGMGQEPVSSDDTDYDKLKIDKSYDLEEFMNETSDIDFSRFT